MQNLAGIDAAAMARLTKGAMKTLLIVLFAAGCAVLWSQLQNKTKELADTNESLATAQALLQQTQVALKKTQDQLQNLIAASARTGAAGQVAQPGSTATPVPGWFQERMQENEPTLKSMAPKKL